MNIQPWKNGDPKISYTTAKRHLRILRRRLEEIMGSQPEPWWAAHHGPIYRRINGNSSGRWKRPSEETAPPCGQGIKQLAYLRTEQQRQCPNSCDYQRTVFRGLQPRYPEYYTCRNRRSTRTEKLVRDLMYEPSRTTLQEELEKIRDNLSRDTPLSWLVEILREELWELKPRFKTVWDQ